MAIYDDPIARLLPQLMGGSRQAFSGVDPDWTALAQMYGFRPNPFPQVGSQGQEEMRFMATLKNIMDQQMAGYGNRLTNLSPGNPMAALPNSMYNYMTGGAALLNSPAAQMIAPEGTSGFFSGGYQPGPLPNAQSPLIAAYLSNLQAGQEGPMSPGTGNTPPISAAAAAATQPAGANPAIAQIAGGNTPEQTPPAANAGPSTSPIANAAADIKTGLSQQPSAATTAAADAVPIPSKPIGPSTTQNADLGLPNKVSLNDPNITTGSGGIMYYTSPKTNQVGIVDNDGTVHPSRDMGRVEQAAFGAKGGLGDAFSNLGSTIEQHIGDVLQQLMGSR
jgi:hypothetical protein